MDKPFQNNLYAGLIIYRLQRNVEFLLLNDSFTNKKHWFCPKGQVIGQEDEVKCALRETFETTGLSPKDLRIEEGFKIELTYLSGTRPKKVAYRLAQILDNHARLLPGADGVHFQWCNQTVASEKVIFKSMVEMFMHAQKFIEAKQRKARKEYQQRQNNSHHRQATTTTTTTSAASLSGMPSLSSTSSAAAGTLSPSGLTSRPLGSPHQQQSSMTTGMASRRLASTSGAGASGGETSTGGGHHHYQQQQNNPWYKTRLCERFETEGSCSYGSKCTFAHGVTELRERPSAEEDNNSQGGSSPAAVAATSNGQNKASHPDASNNPLYKTKLCERFMKDNFCQYGPKCHFAHGLTELKERPVLNGTKQRSDESHNHKSSSSSSNYYNQYQQQQQRQQHGEPSAADGSWRIRSGVESGNNSGSTNAPSPSSVGEPASKSTVQDQQQPQPQPQQNERANTRTPKWNANPLQDVMNGGRISQTNKSWMKIVHLSKEEQAKMDIAPPANTRSPTPGKTAQEEAIIKDLKKFFAEQQTTTTTSRTGNGLSSDVKEVTKLEIRNDLSKRQLLYILLVSLLEDHASNVKTTLQARVGLFKTFVKTTTDQRTLLKAWEMFVTQRSPQMMGKTSVVFSTWYDNDLVDEEVFIGWYDILAENSELKNKSAKFIEWLSTADEEED